MAEVLQLVIMALLFAVVALIFLGDDVMGWVRTVGWLIVGLLAGVAAGLTITEAFHPGFGWAKVLG